MAQDFQVPATGRVEKSGKDVAPAISHAVNSLFDRVSQTPAAQSLARRLESGGALSLAGIPAPAQPFFAALLHQFFPKRPIVVVADSLKTQESFQQDLETWLNEMRSAECGVQSENPTQTPDPKPQTLFFPAWEILPHEGKLPPVDVIAERLETLVALPSDTGLKTGGDFRLPASSKIPGAVPPVVDRYGSKRRSHCLSSGRIAPVDF